MARFPTYERNVGLSGGVTSPYMSDSAMTAPARALQGAGNALQSFGDQMAQVEAKIRETQDDTWVSKARSETAIDIDKQERAAQQSATDGAQGYTDAITKSYEDYRKSKVAQAPSPEAARKYEMWANGYGVDLTKRSAGFQADSELAKRTSDLATTLSNHEQLVYADPSQYDKVKARAEADLKAASAWLTPEQEVAVRDKFTKDLNLARAKGKVDSDPAGFKAEVGDHGPAQWRNAIASIESAGDGGYAAIGPKHPELGRALGRYQIMEANIPAWSKEALGHSVSVEEFMANPKIQDAIFDYKFGGYVRQFGLEGAAQAWFAGPGGVGKTGRKDVLGTDVGSYGQKFVKALGASGFVGDPRYAGLSVDEIRSLSNQADSSIKATQTASYSALKDSFEQNIATGQVTSESDIINSGLNGGDVATLLGKFRTYQKEQGAVVDTLSALASGTFSGDPFDSDTRKSVDGAALAIKQKATPEQYQAATESIVQQSGIVPKDTMNELRLGMQSTDPATVATAANKALRINQIDRAALGRRDGGQQVQDDATLYDHYVNGVGMSPEQAAQRLIDAKDPEKQRARASLMDSKPIKDFIKDTAVESTVRDIFDPGFFGLDPQLGETPAQSAAMVGEYSSILSESIFDANGDTDAGKALADERFRKIYGPSNFTLAGDKVVTRYPPEVTYPADGNGSWDYVRSQAIEALAGEGVAAKEVFLQPDATTEQDVKAGKPARYQLFYKGEDGKLERFMLPFYAIAPTSADTVDQMIAPSEEKMKINRDRLLQGRDRGRSLDNFLNGNPLTGGM